MKHMSADRVVSIFWSNWITQLACLKTITTDQGAEILYGISYSLFYRGNESEYETSHTKPLTRNKFEADQK